MDLAFQHQYIFFKGEKDRTGVSNSPVSSKTFNGTFRTKLSQSYTEPSQAFDKERFVEIVNS